MKIYILVLCLIIIFLKYRLKNNKNIKNKVLKFFNFSCLPFVMIILTLTFNKDIFGYFQNKESIVYSHVYTEAADF